MTPGDRAVPFGSLPKPGRNQARGGAKGGTGAEHLMAPLPSPQQWIRRELQNGEHWPGAPSAWRPRSTRVSKWRRTAARSALRRGGRPGLVVVFVVFALASPRPLPSLSCVPPSGFAARALGPSWGPSHPPGVDGGVSFVWGARLAANRGHGGALWSVARAGPSPAARNVTGRAWRALGLSTPSPFTRRLEPPRGPIFSFPFPRERSAQARRTAPAILADMLPASQRAQGRRLTCCPRPSGRRAGG